MKGIIGLAVFLVVAFWAMNFFFASVLTADQGRNLAVAYFEPYKGELEIQVGIGPLIPMRDPPRRTPKGIDLWDDWVADHFQLRDAQGNEVQLKRMGTSSLFSGSKGGGDPDFVLVGAIKPETPYTFDHIPVVSEGKTYRYEFTSPADASDKPGWRIFELVDES